MSITTTAVMTLSLGLVQAIEEHPQSLDKLLVTIEGKQFETPKTPAITDRYNEATISGRFTLFTANAKRHRKRIMMRPANRLEELQS